MLDNETKRRIDEARDILVGKVPDPKSQVEQITIALIYKFMDDMDRQALEMGGKASFFSGEYEKYAWSKIFDPRLGGHEMLNLYAEAITRLNQNPSLPQLFRDIFKNAFLPYRDPETLKLFLKTINAFQYDHSERLGDAFEYLLAVLDSQGDAGQFRTPRHIIQFMVEAVNPQKGETVLDPACGTAGFLIAAYRHILRSNMKTRPGDLLSPAERRDLMTNFSGYDISPDMVRLSLVNLYLHGFVQPQVYEYDTLTSEERWDTYADVILANPPFMSPKGGIRPHKRFSVQSTRSEVLFVDYIAEHLTPHGRAAVIVPEGIIFQSGNAYKQLRKYLVEEGYLWAVVSLPSGVFNPYSGVKTSILFLDRRLAKKSEHVLFFRVEHDGFDLGAQRRPIEHNDLPAALQALQTWRAVCETGESRTSAPLQPGDQTLLVEKKRLAQGGEYNLTAERYRERVSAARQKYPMVRLGDCCLDIKTGFAYGNSQSDGIPHLRPMNISVDGRLSLDDIKYVPFIDAEKYREYKLLAKDVLFNNTNSKELVGKTCYIETDINAFFSNHMTRIRSNQEKLIPSYLAYILHHMWRNGHFQNLCNKWVGQAGINTSMLSQLQIPLPPLEVQREIVAEIAGYEKIIAAARQVVQNWQPNLAFELEEARRAAGVSAWEMVRLGEVCEINTETANPLDFFGETQITYVDISSVENGSGCINYNNIIHTNEAPSRARRLIHEKDVLLSTVRPNLKAFALVTNPPEKIIASTGFAVLRAGSRIYPEYLYLSIENDHAVSQMISMMGKGAYPSINQSDVACIQIPLPPLEVQREIVARIEAERAGVDACRRLIAIYEDKIRRVVERVWED